MKQVCQAIIELLQYSTHHHLLDQEEVDYAYNKILDVLDLEPCDVEPINQTIPSEPSEIVVPLLNVAVEKGLITPDTTKQRDIFEAKLMDIVMPRPKTIIDTFYSFDTPQERTDYYYDLSQKSNYIKTSRTSKNIIWKAPTKYGDFDITINLSKPEKDPKDIIAQKHTTTMTYPSCLLCKENVGYNGKATGVGRTSHRIIPVTLNEESFYLQYSPYVYYNEHCIVLQSEHIPMNVSRKTFVRLFDFVDQFPHYFLGSNAGLPIVGGSILSHEHYQGGRHTFPIEHARVLSSFKVKDTTFEQLYWPLSVIRLSSSNREELITYATKLYEYWEQYTNKALQIYAHTNNEPHNAITPIARKQGDVYVLDMTLRNNLTTKELPLGVFHPHPAHHHIKKENIGLIEVMGLAVLPARLKDELQQIKSLILNQDKIPASLQDHARWITDLRDLYNGEDIDAFIEREVAVKFTYVLEDAGVFKQTTEGQEAFTTFMKEVQHVLN